MTFFNQKENILELKLTDYGESLHAQGKFKPEYYSFSDDSVNYIFSSSGEGQNDIDGRIKLETPYLRVQKNRFSNTNDGKTINITGIDIETEIAKRESLGKCDTLSSASSRLKIFVLDNEIESFNNFYTSRNELRPDLPIPQIDINLEFKTAVDDFRNPKAPIDANESLSSQELFPDGGAVYVSSQDITLLIEEEGVTSDFEDFEVEVYEILDEGTEPTVDGKAELFIYFTAANATQYGSGQSDPGFKLIDVFRNEQTFRPDDTSTSVANGTVGINGLTTTAEVAQQFVNAINDPSVSALGITASVATEFSADGRLIKVEQDTAGVLGNTVITAINDLTQSDQGVIWTSKFKFFTRANVTNFDVDTGFIEGTIALADGQDLVFPEEVLRRLEFQKQIQDLYVNDDNIYVSEQERGNMLNLINRYPNTTEDVEFYFNVFTDTYDEIPESFICSLVAELKRKDFALDASIEELCPRESTNIIRDNAYINGLTTSDEC
jgi:hypothetical protein